MRRDDSSVPAAAEWLFLAAAVLHLGAVPGHAQTWIGYGAFFVLVGLAQGLYSLLLPRLGHSRRFLVVGIVSTLALLALWLDSRLWHPLVGPHRFHAEAFGILDVTCAVVELVAVVLLVRSVTASSHRTTPHAKELSWT